MRDRTGVSELVGDESAVEERRDRHLGTVGLEAAHVLHLHDRQKNRPRERKKAEDERMLCVWMLLHESYD